MLTSKSLLAGIAVLGIAITFGCDTGIGGTSVGNAFDENTPARVVEESLEVVKFVTETGEKSDSSKNIGTSFFPQINPKYCAHRALAVETVTSFTAAENVTTEVWTGVTTIDYKECEGLAGEVTMPILRICKQLAGGSNKCGIEPPTHLWFADFTTPAAIYDGFIAVDLETTGIWQKMSKYDRESERVTVFDSLITGKSTLFGGLTTNPTLPGVDYSSQRTGFVTATTGSYSISVVINEITVSAFLDGLICGEEYGLTVATSGAIESFDNAGNKFLYEVSECGIAIVALNDNPPETWDRDRANQWRSKISKPFTDLLILWVNVALIGISNLDDDDWISSFGN